MRITLLALPVLLVACTKDVGEGKAKAKVGEAKPAAAAPAAGGLAVDPSRSKITALGAKITGKHLLEFGEWKGSVSLDGEAVSGVEFTVSVASVKSDSERLDKHLRSPDFFDVANHPEAKFVSTGVAPAPAAGSTHSVTGNLTMRGKTKEVTFPATLKVGPEEVTASAEFVINRKDFDVSYRGKPDDLIQDNVVLKIEAVAPR